MGDVVQFGDANERIKQKLQRALDRNGYNEMLIMRMVGMPAVSVPDQSPGDPSTDAGRPTEP